MQVPARVERSSRRGWLPVWVALALLATATPALAQARRPASVDNAGVGEKYWFEFSATFWKPSLSGNVEKDNLDLIRSGVALASDLGLDNSRFTDFRFVLRPAKKHRFKLRYTPVELTGSNALTRELSFGGISYPVSMLVESVLNWKALRVAYEWDFFYRPRGFVGVSVEGGVTDLKAGFNSLIGSKTVSGAAPLISLGVAGRVYPVRNLALNIEASGLRLTGLKGGNILNTLAYDLSATLNFTHKVGVSGGWRRSNTDITRDSNNGQLNLGGLWFGGVLRY